VLPRVGVRNLECILGVVEGTVDPRELDGDGLRVVRGEGDEMNTDGDSVDAGDTMRAGRSDGMNGFGLGDINGDHMTREQNPLMGNRLTLNGVREGIVETMTQVRETARARRES